MKARTYRWSRCLLWLVWLLFFLFLLILLLVWFGVTRESWVPPNATPPWRDYKPPASQEFPGYLELTSTQQVIESAFQDVSSAGISNAGFPLWFHAAGSGSRCCFWHTSTRAERRRSSRQEQAWTLVGLVTMMNSVIYMLVRFRACVTKTKGEWIALSICLCFNP